MSPVLAISGVELRRFLRDRSNIFFMFIFPLLLVLVIGLQFGSNGGGGSLALSGSDGELRQELTASLEEAGVEVSAADPDAMREQVARGRSDAGLYISPDAEAAFADGADAEVELVLGTGTGAQLAAQRLTTATGAISLEHSQRAVLETLGAGEAEATEALEAVDVQPVTLAVTDVGGLAQAFGDVGQFDVGAASQVLLFVFLISLAGSATLIQSRKLGVQSRVAASPVSGGQALIGQALGRWVIAVVQGGYIMLASALLFDVDWGNLGLSLLVLAFFAAVAAGGAMLIGSVIDNDGAASGIGIGAGLVLAALGGCMLPLELFPDTLRAVSKVTPHAWGYEAFAEIQRHGGTLADIAPSLAVLAGMAAVLLALGAWTLRRSLARAL